MWVRHAYIHLCKIAYMEHVQYDIIKECALMCSVAN